MFGGISRGFVFVGVMVLVASGCSRCSRTATRTRIENEGRTVASPVPEAPSDSNVSVQGADAGAGGVPPGNEPAPIPAGTPAVPPVDPSAASSSPMPPGVEENPASAPQAMSPMGSAVLETPEQVRARGKVPMGVPPAPMGFSPEERKRHEEMMARAKTPQPIPTGPLPLPQDLKKIQESGRQPMTPPSL